MRWGSTEVPSSSLRTRAQTLLAQTTQLLQQASLVTDYGQQHNSPTFWHEILESLDGELGTAPAKARIAVCGVDEFSGAKELVTALLENPFSSDPTYSNILRNRWKDHPNNIVIEYDASVTLINHLEVGKLTCPSTWLLQYPYDIQIVELPALSSIPPANTSAAKLLLSSDVLVLLCDPLTTPIPMLSAKAKHLLNRPNTLLVFTSVTPFEHRRSLLSKELADLGCVPGRILFVDPTQALDAIALLQADSTFPYAIERFQKDSLGSQISAIGSAISELFGTRASTDTSLLTLQTRSALIQIQSSLDASFQSVHCAAEGLARVDTGVTKLRSQVMGIKEGAEREVLGAGEHDAVRLALVQGTKRMQTMLESLSFWKMLWRVDEIGSLVSTSFRGEWCKELEHSLILQTGRLSSVQGRLTRSTWDLLSTLASPSPYSNFHSPVLLNQLQQLEASPLYPLTSTTLSQPLRNRRRQIVQYTTPKLHREAQNAVLGALGGTLAGTSVGWWLAIGEHLLGIGTSSEIPTAVGIGALVAISSLRWAVGKWERAKGRWLQDLERVGAGTSRDLKASLQYTIDHNVAVVADTACRRLEDVVTKRREELAGIRVDLEALQTELNSCTNPSLP
ncbi:hypothetical protein V8B97DRAFT_1865865 [Scleroderma yunnanense]